MIHTFVLVHGAWLGGWCWRDVAKILRDAGHRAFTPTLTGLGERSHLLHPDIDVELHVSDVVNVIRSEELRGIVLAGHSYGGMVISGVAERLDEGVIASIVYLDALYTDDGECMADTSPGFDEVVGTTNPIPPFPASFFGYDGEIAARVDRLSTPHPRKTLFTPLRLTGARERIPRKTYVYATEGGLPGFAQMYERLRADASWRTETISCQHHMMLDLPADTAEVLLRAAGVRAKEPRHMTRTPLLRHRVTGDWEPTA